MNRAFINIGQIEKAMRMGGRTLAKRHKIASKVIALLVERGWSYSFVSYVFRSLDDRDVGSCRPPIFAEEWAKYRAYHMQTAFTTVLRQIGIRPAIIYILERRIYRNLVNTCYSEPQLVDIAIEYLLHRRVPLMPIPKRLRRKYLQSHKYFIRERCIF